MCWACSASTWFPACALTSRMKSQEQAHRHLRLPAVLSRLRGLELRFQAAGDSVVVDVLHVGRVHDTVVQGFDRRLHRVGTLHGGNPWNPEEHQQGDEVPRKVCFHPGIEW